MTRDLQAVYEGGVLRPLEALDLREQQIVHITLSDEPPPAPRPDAEDPADWADDGVTLEEVRAALAVIPGRLTDDFIAERDER